MQTQGNGGSGHSTGMGGSTSGLSCLPRLWLLPLLVLPLGLKKCTALAHSPHISLGTPSAGAELIRGLCCLGAGVPSLGKERMRKKCDDLHAELVNTLLQITIISLRKDVLVLIKLCLVVFAPQRALTNESTGKHIRFQSHGKHNSFHWLLTN